MTGTVYVLGAGASRAETFGAARPTPLVHDFFEKKYLEEFWYDIEFGGPFYESPLYFILNRYFSAKIGVKKTSWLGQINIEEVYSFLHSFDAVFSGRSFRRDEFELARKQLHKYLITVVRYTSWAMKGSPYLGKLFSFLGKEDSIVTFNWDTLAEQALRGSGKLGRALLESMADNGVQARSSGFEDAEKRGRKHRAGAFIKVHGGINLTRCINGRCHRSAYPYLWTPEEEMPASWACEECGSPTEEMILSPHSAKTYTSATYFRRQANLAAMKLAMACEIVIIGYSFPAFDMESRSMFRCARLDDDASEAWLSRVTLVDPRATDEAYCSSVIGLLGLDNEEAYGHDVEFCSYATVGGFMEARFK